MYNIIAYENSTQNITCDNLSFWKTISDMGQQVKNELGLRRTPFEISPQGLTIGNVVGCVSLNDVTLKILPKVCKISTSRDDSATLKSILEKTLKCLNDSGRSTIFFSKKSVIDSDAALLVNVMARYFAISLSAASKKSHIVSYKETVLKRSNVRGKILLERQLASPNTDGKLWCRYKELSQDNLLNALLHWACLMFCNMATEQDVKIMLRKLASLFPENNDLLSAASVVAIKIPRQYACYQWCISVAKQYYLQKKHNVKESTGNNQISGYLINMERSFENMVAYYLHKAALVLGYSHRSQVSYLLAKSRENNNAGFETRPDNIISSLSCPKTILIDAKYKSLDTGNKHHHKPSNEDFYQMICSCLSPRAHEAILVYPNNAHFPGGTWSTCQPLNGNVVDIHAASIDVVASDEDVINSFVEILKNTNFFRSTSNAI